MKILTTLSVPIIALLFGCASGGDAATAVGSTSTATLRQVAHSHLQRGVQVHDACINLIDVGDQSSVEFLINALPPRPPIPENDVICTWSHCAAALQRITGKSCGFYREGWKECLSAVAGTDAQAPGASSTLEGTPAAPHAFKGYELYSWRDVRGQWLYALLLGTNRLKTAEEILSAGIPEAQLRLELAKLPPGESVSWCPPSGVELEPPFSNPPAPVVDRLLALARERGVHLTLCAAQS